MSYDVERQVSDPIVSGVGSWSVAAGPAAVERARVAPRDLGRALPTPSPSHLDLGSELAVDLPLTGRRARAKRAFDAVVGAALLGVSAPVVLGAAALVKLSSRGPAFFRQERIGMNGETISICKLRTMCVDAEETLHRDPALRARYLEGDCKVDEASDYRVTPVGRKLRSWSFDELPQLWDVVCGRMSLVGPRPALPEQVHSYGAMLPAYLSVRPGLTGAWQVDGRSQVRFPERAAIDFEYVTNWSFRRDLAILLRTVPATLARRGAH